MHVVYRLAEFGLWEANRKDVTPEVAFLNGMIPVAMETDDVDMLGELLDCLNAVEMVSSVNGGGDDGLSNVARGRAHLVSMQHADGSFSSMEDPDHWHTTHVAGLTLLPRPRGREVSTLVMGGKKREVTNEEFWSVAKDIMPVEEGGDGEQVQHNEM